MRQGCGVGRLEGPFLGRQAQGAGVFARLLDSTSAIKISRPYCEFVQRAW